MNSPEIIEKDRTGFLTLLQSKTAFSRLDEGEDRLFYEKPRLVAHLDSLALHTVELLTESLIVEDRPIILDLMASWDSHLGKSLKPAKVVGLGMNREELEANPILDERIIHDLNANPELPFANGSFDVVINSLSVEYITRPYAVAHEVGRILKPGGLFLIVFSNRMFPQKVVRCWHEMSEEDRINAVRHFLAKFVA